MTSSSFYEDGSKLLTPGAFEFVLDSELKRAVRSQNYLTLVTVEASREWEGMMVTADDGTLLEVAQIIGREVRDTDLLGHTEKGTLALVLLDADFDHSTRVIDRLVSRTWLPMIDAISCSVPSSAVTVMPSHSRLASTVTSVR